MATTPPAPLVTLLAGGASGRQLDRLIDQAADVGAEVRYHVPVSARRIPAVPSDVELVVFLVSHISHQIYGTIKAVAKDRGLPVARVPSAGFLPSLQAELEKLGLAEGRFGAMRSARAGGYYELSPHGHWVWMDLTEIEPPAAGSGGEGLLATGVVLGSMLAAWRG